MTVDKTPLEAVRQYYGDKILRHGATPQGVDWRDENSQEARFHQLASILDKDPTASLADIGCGYGALARFLRGRGWRGHYEGVDVSAEMLAAAQTYLQDDPNFSLTEGQSPQQPAEFVVASGIFNVKGGASTGVWESYVFETIDTLVEHASKGAAFNCLTSWSDPPYMRDDLYYAAPEKMFEYCARRHSRWIELSQDYGLFEFTIRLRLDREVPRLRTAK